MAAFVPDSALTTTCILRTFPIQPPIMNSAAAAFLESFGTTNISVEAAALIRKLTEDRQTLISLMNKDPGDMNAVYKYAEQYLQNLSQLLESLNCCGSVRLQKMLALSWRGAQGLIDEAHRIPSTVQQEIIYEIIMIIYVLGLAKYATAVNLLHSNGAPISKEALKEAAKCFLDAAGIFQYLVEDTLPRWLNRTKAASIVPEASEALATLIKGLCVTCANQCIVAQAIDRGSPSNILCKLSAAVAHSAGEAIGLYVKVGGRIDTGLPAHLAFLKQFYTGFAYYHAGVVAAKGAKAVAFYGAVVTVLRQQGSSADPTAPHNPLLPGLPKLSGSYAPCLPPLGAFLGMVKAAHETADADNRLIYFESNLASVELPEPAFLATVKKYAAPAAGVILDFAPPAKMAAPVPTPAPVTAPASVPAPAASASGLSAEDLAAVAAIDAAVAKTSISGPPPAQAAYPASMPPAMHHVPMSAPAMSDEEYARFLQKQFDEGAAR